MCPRTLPCSMCATHEHEPTAVGMLAMWALSWLAHEAIPPNHVKCLPKVGTKLVWCEMVPYVRPHRLPVKLDMWESEIPLKLTWRRCVAAALDEASPKSN